MANEIKLCSCYYQGRVCKDLKIEQLENIVNDGLMSQENFNSATVQTSRREGHDSEGKSSDPCENVQEQPQARSILQQSCSVAKRAACAVD